MRILFIGDVVGKPGRRAVATLVPRLREERNIDFVIANGENSAHGAGLTASTVDALLASGVEVITSGDHVWDQKEVYEVIEHEPRLLRPLNFPAAAPGRGSIVVEREGLPPVGVLNLIGRVFMPNTDCPFVRPRRKSRACGNRRISSSWTCTRRPLVRKSQWAGFWMER